MHIHTQKCPCPRCQTGKAMRRGIEMKLYKYAMATNINQVKWLLPDRSAEKRLDEHFDRDLLSVSMGLRIPHERMQRRRTRWRRPVPWTATLADVEVRLSLSAAKISRGGIGGGLSAPSAAPTPEQRRDRITKFNEWLTGSVRLIIRRLMDDFFDCIGSIAKLATQMTKMFTERWCLRCSMKLIGQWLVDQTRNESDDMDLSSRRRRRLYLL